MGQENRATLTLRQAELADWAFWQALEPHCKAEQFAKKTQSGQAFLICRGQKPAGLMDYVLLWDKLPFLNCLFVLPESRGQGAGRFAMGAWEKEMQKAGYPMVLLSTQADEEAQRFYRRLGYRDCGCLILDRCPLAQPAELFFCKIL